MMRLAGKKRAEDVVRAAPRARLGRRELVRGLAGGALSLLTACAPSGRSVAPNAAGAVAPAAPPRPPSPPPKAFGGPVELHSWFDLPDDPRSRELSGIAWDDATRTLWAVQDETANIVPIVPDGELRTWGFGPVITLRMSFPLDLEGIVVVPHGFIVASEKGPRILEVDRAGKLRRDIALPAHYSKARDNRSIESLTRSPDGRYLFTTTEEALSCDGARTTDVAGTHLRILRITSEGGDAEEHAYATDPVPHSSGDYGVADLAALSSDDLLVLERGWSHGSGNTARIYRCTIGDEATSCISVPELASDAPVMKKVLVVDLAKLATKGMPKERQKQDSPLLDNFEGLSLGPTLPDGRRTLLLVSDDNGRSDQFARIVVLAVG